jgi:hypothetical protein
MAIAREVFPLMAALKELHREILALRKDIDELRDEVGSGGIQFVLDEGADSETDSETESETGSVQSAPF